MWSRHIGAPTLFPFKRGLYHVHTFYNLWNSLRRLLPSGKVENRYKFIFEDLFNFTNMKNPGRYLVLDFTIFSAALRENYQ